MKPTIRTLNLLLCIVLTVGAFSMAGCITASLWELEDQKDPASEDVETPPDEPATSEKPTPLWGKILLTPLALLADVGLALMMGILLSPFDTDDANEWEEGTPHVEDKEERRIEVVVP